MTQSYSFRPHWTCSQRMDVVLDGDIVQEVKFHGGCSGNTKGVCALARGRKVQDVIEALEGIKCGPRSTSCPDQLARGLKRILAEQAAEAQS